MREVDGVMRDANFDDLTARMHLFAEIDLPSI
jgi:hypothetical protein